MLRIWWHRNRQFALIAGAAIIIIFVFFTAVSIWGWNWTGFNGGYSQITTHTPAKDTVLPAGKTLWDWLQLTGVIAIPIAVAWFTTRQSHDLQIAAENQREVALQIYMDKMSELILEKRLRDSRPGDEVRKIARARTLTVLSSLDGNRKRTVVQFLHDSGLIDHNNEVIDLSFADLRGANLVQVDLSGIRLSRADLSGAKLNFTNLQESDLHFADLQGADLNFANLIRANLMGAALTGANLGDAHLEGADLSEAILSRANLRNANLRGANLQGSKLTAEQLSKARSQGAIMPDGSKHP